MSDVEFHQEGNGDWRWRVTADNNRIVGASTEGYRRKIDAENNFSSLCRYCRSTDIKIASSAEERPEGARLPLEFYKNEEGDWRWRVTAANGKVVHASTEGYQNKNDAVENLTALSTESRAWSSQS